MKDQILVKNTEDEFFDDGYADAVLEEVIDFCETIAAEYRWHSCGYDVDDIYQAMWADNYEGHAECFDKCKAWLISKSNDFGLHLWQNKEEPFLRCPKCGHPIRKINSLRYSLERCNFCPKCGRKLVNYLQRKGKEL